MFKKSSLNILAYLSMASLGVYLSAYQSALPAITGEFTLDGRTSGIIISLHFIASFIFPLILGPVADRVGRRPVLTGCFAALLLATLLITIAPSAILLGAGIFAVGGAFCVVEGSMSSLLAEVNPGKEDKVMNLSQMYFCAGAVAGPLVGRLTFAAGFDWRGGYYAVLALFALCLILTAALKMPPAKRTEADKTGEKPQPRFKPNKYYLLLVAAMFVYVAVEEGAAFWTGSFVENSLGAGTQTAYFLSAFWLGMALGRLAASFGDRAVDRLAMAGIVISLAALTGVLVFSGAAAMLVCFFIVGLGIAPIWPLIMSRAAVSSPNSPDAAAGGIMSAGAAGAVVAPALLGWISDYAGIRVSFAILPAALLLLFSLQIMVSRSLSVKRRKDSGGD